MLPNDRHETVKRSFDLLGFLLLSPGIALLMCGLDRLGMGAKNNGAIDAEVELAVLLLLAFFWHANRLSSAELIDLKLFQNRAFSAAAVTQFFGNCVFLAARCCFRCTS